MECSFFWLSQQCCFSRSCCERGTISWNWFSKSTFDQGNLASIFGSWPQLSLDYLATCDASWSLICRRLWRGTSALTDALSCGCQRDSDLAQVTQSCRNLVSIHYLKVSWVGLPSSLCSSSVWSQSLPEVLALSEDTRHQSPETTSLCHGASKS